MFILKRIFCRGFQSAFRLYLPLLPYREPEILTSCRQLCGIFNKEKISNPLIVTDKGIVLSGTLDILTDALDDSGVDYHVFDETLPNPTVNNVEAALESYKKQGCDGIIAIGGGSSMDCAKALVARLAYPDKDLNHMKGVLHIIKKIPCLIAIPTTAGTGSETTPAAVITDKEKHDKYALISFSLIPDYAVLDERLTYTLPPHITATSGMDALTHAVEAYIGGYSTKETAKLALYATKLIFSNLERSYLNPTDSEARKAMLMASYNAGLAFSKSYVGYIHAVAHSLGGYYDTPHGLANAVIMPYVLDEYGSCIHSKLKELAVGAGISTKAENEAKAAQKFINHIRLMNVRIGIPDTIKGIKLSDISELAKHADREANPLYPVPKLMTAKELELFYYKIADWSR